MSTYSVTNPMTEVTSATYQAFTDAQVAAAIVTAADAHRVWAGDWTVPMRRQVLTRIAELHRERRHHLAEIIVREMGKPLTQALGEVDFSADIFDYYADQADTFLADEPIELQAGTGTALIRRSPVGVLLGIMPWNFPYYQVARFAAPNLLVGNSILLKHAPQCPESATAIQDLFEDAGLPQGTYQHLFASNEQVADLIADSRIRGVSLTGSSRAGAAVAEIAGRHLTKVVLELGGSDPFIVLSSDDLDTVVEAAAATRLENSGQTCNAAKRFIIHTDLYDEFLDKFAHRLLTTAVEDPQLLSTVLGPLSSVGAAENLERQVDAAVAHGATRHGTRQRHGAEFYPVVLTEVSPENPAHHEEFFGPVALVYRVATEQDAVDVANDSPFGLGSYVFSTDPDQAARVADLLDAGMVFINLVGAESPELPFGGVKNSGFGRELGRAGLDEFVNKKLIRTGT